MFNKFAEIWLVTTWLVGASCMF